MNKFYTNAKEAWTNRLISTRAGFELISFQFVKLLIRPFIVVIIFSIALLQEASAQCTLVCNDDMQISLFNQNDINIQPEMLLVNPGANCPNGDYSLVIRDETGASLGQVVNYQYIGQALTFSITDNASGHNCSGHLELEDRVAPIIECEEVFVACHASTSPEDMGYPAVSDNIDALDNTDLSYYDDFTDLSCFVEVNGQVVTAQIERIWTAVDASDNETNCSQMIYLKRSTLEGVSFPLDFDDIHQASLRCNQDNYEDLALTGMPMIGTQLIGDNNTVCEFSVTYSDQIEYECAGGMRILRDWTVLDRCNDQILKDLQVIWVKDKEAPSITCPDSMYFHTVTDDCETSVFLDPAIGEDNCSEVTILAEWEFGTGTGPFFNVPFGEHVVTYTAVDNCGNEISCLSWVVVKDNNAPTAVCDQQITVNLQPNGTTTLYASAFNNGSHDNCGIAYFEASKDNENFSELLNFDCQDITGERVPIHVKVYDSNGFSSSCLAQVEVVDLAAPDLTCPPSASVDCAADFTDLSLTGEPIATDICGIDFQKFSDEIALNNCGFGTITRTWTVADIYGNLRSCEQPINITDNTPTTVTFPENYDFYECGVDTEPEALGMPELLGVSCESDIGITYLDQVFITSYPACFKLLRRWTVVDWCRYDPDDAFSEGYWEKVQTINVFDTIAPVIRCPNDTIVAIREGGCETFVQLQAIFATDCSEELSITNNSPYASRSDADASGVYPFGVHEVTFTATDACGNTSACIQTIEVVDGQPPTPICIDGVTIPLGTASEIILTPEMVSINSTDNCSDSENLELEVIPNTFSCQDVGQQEVVLTARDDSGNEAYCYLTINIQDNHNICPPSTVTTAQISGSVHALTGQTLEAVELQLSGGKNTNVMTGQDGSYIFDDLQMERNYTITPVAPDDYANGLTTFDLIKIRKHILGVESFDTPYKHIAADANQSNSVTTYDIVIFKKTILQTATDFGGTPSWRFVDANFNFPENTYNPLETAIPETITVDQLNNNQSNRNFVAIKVGDLDISGTWNFAETTDERDVKGDLILQTENVAMKKDYTYEVPITARNFEHIEGLQLTIDFDETQVELLDIETGALPALKASDFGWKSANEGKITFSWEYFHDTPLSPEQALFTLKLKAKQSVPLKKVLQLNSSIIRAEAYTYNADFWNILFDFQEIQQTKEYKLYPNYPNPFVDQTVIPFHLPKPTEVTLTLYDFTGKIVFQQKEQLAQGYHQIPIDLTGIPTEGLLYYSLDSPLTKQLVKTAIRIEEE